MNRRDFLKNTSKSILAGLFGAFIVAEELGKFAEQKELEQQMSNSDGDNFDNTEWNLDWQAKELYYYPGIDKIITTGHHKC